MRGKIVVIVMILGGALMLAYSLWYVGSHSPIDQRFNMKRKSLPDNAPGPAILPMQAGDYSRSALEIDTLDTLDTPGVVRHGKATYLVEEKPVQLEVKAIRGNKPTLNDLFTDFATRAGAPSMNDGGIAVTTHPEASLPYGFGAYLGPAYTYYEFTWINGNWIFRVSTREAGSESLLRFVNGYVF